MVKNSVFFIRNDGFSDYFSKDELSFMSRFVYNHSRSGDGDRG